MSHRIRAPWISLSLAFLAVLAYLPLLWIVTIHDVGHLLLSPFGSESLVALLLALAFVTTRIIVTFVVPALVTWAAARFLWDCAAARQRFRGSRP